MHRWPRLAGAILLSAVLLAGLEAQGGETGRVHPVPGLEPFDRRALQGLPAEDARFLEELFLVTDEAAEINGETLRWLLSEGAEGLHPDAHAERGAALRLRLAAAATPTRLHGVRGYVAESLRHQEDFLAEWYGALSAGRRFESQLTNEYAHHPGLHRSHRNLRKAYAELRGVFPRAGHAVHREFRRRLRAMDLR